MKCSERGCFRASGHDGPHKSAAEVFGGRRRVEGLRELWSDAMENTESSGGTRYSEGKPGHWWCAPLRGLRLVAEVWTFGAEKYAPMDWKEGQSYSTLIDCAMRHMLEVLDKGPLARDPDSKDGKVLHLAAVAWNILCLLTFIADGREDLNDVDKWRGVTADMKASGCFPPGTPVRGAHHEEAQQRYENMYRGPTNPEREII